MPLSPTWSYDLGQAMLDAALSCGAECDRTWVSDGSRVESPPPSSDCQCQLVAVPREGWAPPRDECGIRRFAEIQLLLDLCVEGPPARDALPDPVATNTRAQTNASIRWLMMSGLRAAWGTYVILGDPLPGLQEGHITPDGWRLLRSSPGSARWGTTWRFEADE